MFSENEFQSLLPLACAWVEEQEKIILRDGVPLSSAQIADAQKIGIIHPENVRLLEVSAIPLPENQVLRDAAKSVELITPSTIGMTLRYGIFIRADYWGDRRLVCHELVHTMQYERMGGIKNFLQQYLAECIKIGYPAAPMEQEAVQTTARMCDKP